MFKRTLLLFAFITLFSGYAYAKNNSISSPDGVHFKINLSKDCDTEIIENNPDTGLGTTLIVLSKNNKTIITPESKVLFGLKPTDNQLKRMAKLSKVSMPENICNKASEPIKIAYGDFKGYAVSVKDNDKISGYNYILSAIGEIEGNFITVLAYGQDEEQINVNLSIVLNSIKKIK